MTSASVYKRYGQFSSFSFAGRTSKGISMPCMYSKFGSCRDQRIRDVRGGLGLDFYEKSAMQNLNDRLAAYLNKVQMLEKTNEQLERQIREWFNKSGPTTHDYAHYHTTISDLHKKIRVANMENGRIILQIDNTKLIAEDFKDKYESELIITQTVNADITHQRHEIDKLTMCRSEMEMEIESFRKELICMKKDHEAEMAGLLSYMNNNSVVVEVDAAPQQDLFRILQEMRVQYERITEKNRKDMEAWYKAKFDKLKNTSIEIHTSHTKINELKRTFESLQIELQSHMCKKESLEQSLCDTESRYSLMLSKLETFINNLEASLKEVSLKSYREKITKLEMEIAEYRRLLQVEDVKNTTVVQIIEDIPPVCVLKVEPVVQKRTVVEEIVDGEVVSHTEDIEVVNK